MAAAIVPMVAVTVCLALTSAHLERPLVTAMYWSYLIAASMAVGLYWWSCRPASRFGPLLIVFGVLVWIVSWESSNSPLAFDIAVLVEAPAYWLTFYLFLAFPTGRVQPAVARWLVYALAIAIVTFFLPRALLAPVIASGGPLAQCVPKCPDNVLQLASAPGIVKATGTATNYSDLAIILGVLVAYVVRIRGASRPQRRALMAVAVTSLLFLPMRWVFSVSASILGLAPATLDKLAWGLVGARVLMPLGFLVALLQAQRFAMRASQALLVHLAARPSPEQWRDEIATTLDDHALRLGYYDPAAGRFTDADGTEVTPPPIGSGRVWVPVGRGRHAVAAMVMDESLAEDPELIRAASSATLLAIQNGDLEGELRDSRTRIVEAGDAERRRIERDLHDSAQQRLVALRIHLTLAGEQLDRTEDQALLDRLGAEVDDAIADLRVIAHGIYPPILTDYGVGAALSEAADRSPRPVRIRDAWRRRHTELVESTVYFCSRECLQNATKHAGPGATITIQLRETDGQVSFEVADDGTGFDPETVKRGAGLTNLAERVAAVGGRLQIDAVPGHGTRVTGVIPEPV